MKIAACRPTDLGVLGGLGPEVCMALVVDWVTVEDGPHQPQPGPAHFGQGSSLGLFPIGTVQGSGLIQSLISNQAKQGVNNYTKGFAFGTNVSRGTTKEGGVGNQSRLGLNVGKSKAKLTRLKSFQLELNSLYPSKIWI